VASALNAGTKYWNVGMKMDNALDSISSKFLKWVQPIPIQRPLPINEKELSAIESLAQRHNLLMLLYVQLKKYYNQNSKNIDLHNYLEERKIAFLTNAAHSMRQKEIEKKILSLLKKEQIPAIVIKGNEIAMEIYNDPDCRTSVDIDILIKMSHARRADTILTKAGYSRIDENPIGFWFSRLHHAQYVHPQKDDIIEVHWAFGIPNFFRLTSEKIWDEVICTDSGQYKLSPDMMLVQLLIHHQRHAFRELKILIDILWTMWRYESEIDWSAFSEKLGDIGLVKTTQITLKQIRSLWTESSEEMQCLQKLDNEMNKMRCKAPGFLHSYFKMDIETGNLFNTTKDLIFFRLVLDRRSAILFSFLKTILPFPHAIKELYEDKRNWRLPLNYLRFIRWRLGEWRN